MGLSAEAARLIVARNLAPCEGGFTWTTDARLHGASAVKMTPGQVQSLMRALSMPVLLLLAESTKATRYPTRIR